jgi:hypothetical protein
MSMVWHLRCIVIAFLSGTFLALIGFSMAVLAGEGLTGFLRSGFLFIMIHKLWGSVIL